MTYIIIVLGFFGGLQESRVVSELTCLEIQDAVYSGTVVTDYYTGRRIIDAECRADEHNEIALFGWGP